MKTHMFISDHKSKSQSQPYLDWWTNEFLRLLTPKHGGGKDYFQKQLNVFIAHCSLGKNP